MRRRIIAALAVGVIAAGGLPLAAVAIGPGQDSSGQHSWMTECLGIDEDGFIDIGFTNTSEESVIFYTTFDGLIEVEGGSSDTFQGDLGEDWAVLLLDLTVVDFGSFDDCDESPATTTTAAPTETTAPPTAVTSGPTTTVAADNLVASRPDGFTVTIGEPVTLGASGFKPGEVVTATLFSTPRLLGTLTADAAGAVSVTFTVTASDGAGAHRVEFTGPSGTVSIEFTATAAQTLPVTL